MLADRDLMNILIKDYKCSLPEMYLYYKIREIYYFWGSKLGCYASNEALAKEVGVSVASIKRCLSKLSDKKLIKICISMKSGCLSDRNIYPLEDSLMMLNLEKNKTERQSLEKERMDVEINNEGQNEPRDEGQFVCHEGQNEPRTRVNLISNEGQFELQTNKVTNKVEATKEDICPSSAKTYVNSRIEGADAPVKTSFDVSISKPMFENDPKERWNKIASRYHLSKVHRFDKDRIASLKARIKDCDGEDVFWKTIEAALERSKFLQGKSSNWKPNVDFFLRRSSFVKVAEGAYTTQKASLIESDNSSPIEQAVNGYKPQSQAELIEAFLNS